MFNDRYEIVESIKKCKLLALFNALEERDKDMVISISESLVEKYKNNLSKIITDFPAEKISGKF